MKSIAADRKVALIAADATAAASESASCATPALCIERTITADMPDGQRLPPFTNQGVVWHVVRRASMAARRGVVCFFSLPLLPSLSGARRREIKHERRKETTKWI